MPPREPVGQLPSRPQTRRASLRREARALAPHARRLFVTLQQSMLLASHLGPSTPFPDLTTLMELQREALQLTKELTVRVNALEHLAAVPNPPQATQR